MKKECRIKAKIKGEYYIWRTKEDEDVRWQHAVRNGQIFRWDGAPLLPGSEYGCRCWAEPVDIKYDNELDKVFKK
jgi:SPP1 gp7 family putative phage head morphogenesis protein